MLRRVGQGCAISFFALMLLACGDSDNYAPVTEINTIDPIPRAGVHRTARQESVYEVAWRYGLDYRQLVASNHLKSPYILRKGQVISLGVANTNSVVHAKVSVSPENTTFIPITPTVIAVTPTVIPAPSTVIPAKAGIHLKPASEETSEIDSRFRGNDSVWIWPAKGRVINYYSGFNKGINISGRLGEPIYAAAGGKVVYCGSGLRGYGNLIIIKHNQMYLSAYAYNRQLFVKEGQWVKQGQKIADMGENSGSGKAMLHFEIRRAGKPIDPMTMKLG
ncbi:MAG: peptidoglycan DD-metalloendopeptidase family protein [Gammaproteobacteria bacterium]